MAYRPPSDDHPSWNRVEVGPKAGEPTLDQLLAEPIIQQLMHRDRIDEKAIRNVIRRATNAHVARPTHPANDNPYDMMSLLLDITRLWHKRYNSEVRARISGMTYARSAVLIQLLLPEALNQASLAQRLAIKPISLVRLLDQLEAEGLIVRMPDPWGGRSHSIALTAKSRPVAEGINNLTRRIHRDAFTGISEVEANHLLALLQRVQSHLSAHPESGSQVWIQR